MWKKWKIMFVLASGALVSSTSWMIATHHESFEVGYGISFVVMLITAIIAACIEDHSIPKETESEVLEKEEKPTVPSVTVQDCLAFMDTASCGMEEPLSVKVAALKRVSERVQEESEYLSPEQKWAFEERLSQDVWQLLQAYKCLSPEQKLVYTPDMEEALDGLHENVSHFERHIKEEKDKAFRLAIRVLRTKMKQE